MPPGGTTVGDSPSVIRVDGMKLYLWKEEGIVDAIRCCHRTYSMIEMKMKDERSCVNLKKVVLVL